MLAILTPLIAAIDFKVCTSNDHAHVKTVSLDPEQPVHGKAVHVTIAALPDIAITGGKVKVGVTSYGIPIPDSPTFDLCHVGFHCPSKPQDALTATVSYTVSSLVPAGISATIKLHVEDAKGTEIGCVSFDVNVKDESSIHSFFGGVEDSMGKINPFRKLEGQVEAPPSALSKLLSAPSTEKADDLRAKLQDAYSEQPAWAKLFTAWRAQQQGKPAYASPLEEGKRFAAFKANLLRMEGTSARNYLADKHADKTHDEMRTFAHFA